MKDWRDKRGRNKPDNITVYIKLNINCNITVYNKLIYKWRVYVC